MVDAKMLDVHAVLWQVEIRPVLPEIRTARVDFIIRLVLILNAQSEQMIGNLTLFKTFNFLVVEGADLIVIQEVQVLAFGLEVERIAGWK